MPDLRDLCALPFVTIDNHDSRDLDQALFVTAGPGPGEHVVHYALADASYYVRPGEPLFDEGLERGASFYLPGRSVPMLPRALSEDLVSLNPEVNRRALNFEMRLNAEGEIVDVQVYRARIHSRGKLTYPGVQFLYDAPERSLLRGQVYTESLGLLKVVGLQRIALAEARDVVAYDRVRVNVGPVKGQRGRFASAAEDRLEVERYNEQISLMCNIERAKILSRLSRVDPELFAVFRVHPAPQADRAPALSATIEAIIDALKLDPRAWRWRRGDESLAAYFRRLPRGAGDRPVFLAIQRQALLMQQRSVFAAEPGPHSGVGAPCYARVSSPMREVVGIFTHKELIEALAHQDAAAGDDGAGDGPQDAALQPQVIAAANRDKDLQRRLTKDAERLAIDDTLQGQLDQALGRARGWMPSWSGSGGRSSMCGSAAMFR